MVANTAAEKRKEIARRLDGMAKDVDGGSLAAGELKVDGEIAGVLVRKGGGFDPARLKVFAVALVKRGGKWLPTPVLSSFENTGMGYTAEWRRRVQAMEEWMLRGQIEDLEVLRKEATTRMRSEIEARLTVDELYEGTAEEVGKRFVEACGKRDLPAMLGMLGGLREVLPQDWNLRLKAADAAVGDGDRVKRPWRLLVAPEVLRVLVHEESDAKSGLISIACLDPAGVRAGSTVSATLETPQPTKKTMTIAAMTEMTRPTMPSTSPAVATPPFVACPCLALLRPRMPNTIARIEPIGPRQTNCRMPMTRAAVPMPLSGAAG